MPDIRGEYIRRFKGDPEKELAPNGKVFCKLTPRGTHPTWAKLYARAQRDWAKEAADGGDDDGE